MSASVYAERLPEFYAPYLARFRPLEGPFLELGAGYGLLLRLAKSRGLEVFGVEFSEERVAACQSHGLDVQQHDLADPLPLEDESFATIYCGQVIEHCPPATQRMLVREAYRVLKPSGQFQICSPCRHFEAARLQDGHDYLLTPTELQALLRDAGFSDIKPLDYPQHVPEIPPEELQFIWEAYHPDLLSLSASALCTK
jgi:SAM-dependent methyltransferase